ncbi:MAG: zinc-ribbon domain-containing protein [Oscillospiraceae bacterium]
MAFCTSCGSKIEDGSGFCEQCGARQDVPEQIFTPHEANTTDPAYDAAPPTPQATVYGDTGYGGGVAAPPVPRAPMTKRTKIILAAIAAVIVVVGGVSMIMGQLFTAEKTISKFVDSIRAEDFGKFSSVTVPVTKEMTLSEESIAPFFALCKNDMDWLSQFKTSLQEDAKELKRGISADGNGMLRLVKHDYFLFETYQVEFSGASITISTPLPNTTVELGTQSILLTEGDSSQFVENLIPGTYTLKATAKNEFGGNDFVYEAEECVITPYGDPEIYLDFSFISLAMEKPDYPIAGLSVNGKSYTGDFSFGDTYELQIYPLNPGDVVKAEFEVAGIKMDDTFKVGEYNDYFTPRPQMPEKNRKEALALAGDFITRFYTALSAQDSETLTAMDATENNFIDGNLSRLASNKEDPEDRTVFTYVITDLQGDLDFEQSYSDKYDLYFGAQIYIAYDYHMDSYWGNPNVPQDTEDSDSEQVYNAYFGCKADGTWELSSIHSTYYGSLANLDSPVSLLK